MSLEGPLSFQDPIESIESIDRPLDLIDQCPRGIKFRLRRPLGGVSVVVAFHKTHTTTTIADHIDRRAAACKQCVHDQL